MKAILVVLLFCMAGAAPAQNYFGKTRSGVYKGLLAYKKAGRYHNSPVTETDSSVVLTLTDSTVQPFRFEYVFNAKGKCIKEEMSSVECDSCFQKLTKEMLSHPKMKWLRIGNQEYFSKPGKQYLQIEKTGRLNRRTLYFLKWDKQRFTALKSRLPE